MIKLEDVCEISSGGTPSRGKPKYYLGSIPWAKISDIENAKDGVILETEEHISEEGLKSIGNRIFPEGTLLFAMYGSIGKVAITGRAIATNQAILGIRPRINKEVHLPYLKAWFERNKQTLINQGRGVALKNLSATIVRNLKLLLPPLPDQIRIANTLSKAEALISQRKESLRLLDEFLKSTFLEMFGDPSLNSKGFPIGTIRDVVTEVKYGTSKPAKDTGQYPYLRMNNITTDGYWDFTSLRYIDLKDSEKEKYIVKKGDLLFNRTNSKELVGKTAVFTSGKQMVAAGYLIRVRTNNKANPWYLWGHLNSDRGKKTLFAMCKSIVGMANINAQELQDIKILIPPIELQNHYAEIVKNAEALKIHYLNSKHQLENLYGSLSQRAFRGNLNLKEEPLAMAAEPEVKYQKSRK